MTVFDELSRVTAETLPQFTVISGENDNIISELKTQILEKIGFDSSDLSQAYFDMTESDPDLALEELESLPFFGDGMLVVFENLWDLTTVKKSVLNDKQLTRLEHFLDHPLESTQVIFIFHGKLDGKRRIVKKLKKIAFDLEATDLKSNESSVPLAPSSVLKSSTDDVKADGKDGVLMRIYADDKKLKKLTDFMRAVGVQYELL